MKTAIITAATEGIASVSISGQSVQTYNLDQLRKLLEYILADLATENTHGGMRLRQLVPGDTG